MQGQAVSQTGSNARVIAPVVGGLIALIILIAEYFYIRSSLGGKFVYALDDPYIHMAISKNFLHGVWGTDPHVSVSASSSPLWNLIICGVFAVVGPQEFVPLILTMTFAVVCSGAFSSLALRLERGPIVAGVAGACLALLLPAVTLVFIGMEHMMHCTVVIFYALFLYRSALKDSFSGKDLAIAFAFTFFLQLIRFESVFITILPAIYFFVGRQRRIGIALIGGSVIAVLLFGLFSLKMGMNFVPNSIVLKSVEQKQGSDLLKMVLGSKLLSQLVTNCATVAITLTSLIAVIAYRLRKESHAPVMAFVLGPALLVLGGVLIYQFVTPPPPGQTPFPALQGFALFLFFASALVLTFGILYKLKTPEVRNRQFELLFSTILVGTLLHGAFANFGWFFRYDAYLICFFMVTCLLLWKEGLTTIRESLPHMTPLATTAFFFFAIEVGARAQSASHQTPLACNDIATQQLMMAKFINEFYPHGTIAANDIGLISWATDARIVDIYGLSSDKVRLLKRSGNYNGVELAKLVKDENVDAIIAYAGWLIRDGDGKPESWYDVQFWRYPMTYVAGDHEVHFMADDIEKAKALYANCMKFIPELPKDVTSIRPDVPK